MLLLGWVQGLSFGVQDCFLPFLGASRLLYEEGCT